MFNRLKGFNLDSFLDGKIAEEQAKQANPSKSSPAARRTPSNAPGNPRRSSARTDSPSQRNGSRRRAQDGEPSTTFKAPDPEDFVIGDDASDISRVATPMPVKEGDDGPILGVKTEDASKDAAVDKQDTPPVADKGKAKDIPTTEEELPDDVRKKLARLESLTTKYQELLRNYRTAHARVAAIEPFEATLREHTPLTSIVDPSALVEFLNQRSVQSEMVMQELKRLSAENQGVVKERDELKVKLEEAEKEARAAHDEAAGLRSQREEAASTSETAVKVDKVTNGTSEADKPEDDAFFSYDSESQRLEEEAQNHRKELEDQTNLINELSTELATAQSDYQTTKSDLENRSRDLNAMENKVGVKEREIAGLRSQLDSIKAELASATTARNIDREDGGVASISLVNSEARISDLQTQLESFKKSLESKDKELAWMVAVAEENLKKYQQEHEENLNHSKRVQREEKAKEIHQSVLNTLKAQVTTAEEEKQIAEGRNKELQFELNRLTSEADNSDHLIKQLRGHEDAVASWKRRAEAAEEERDTARGVAETKKGHEGRVASLKAQLKNARDERDKAYQMIIDCSRCEPANKASIQSLQLPIEDSTPTERSRQGSETTQQTEVSTQPTEVSTPSASVDGADPMANAEVKKKSKKRKSKAKKTATAEGATAEVAVTQGAATSSRKPVDLASFLKDRKLPADEDLPEASPEIQKLVAENGPEGLKAFIRKKMDEVGVSETDMGRELYKMQQRSIDEHVMTLADRDRTIEDRDEEIQGLHDKNARHVMRYAECEQKMKSMDEENAKQVRTIGEHTRLIEEKDEEIQTLHHKIGEQEAAIERLDKRLKGEEGLNEEIETLRESLLEAGSESTDAKHELKELKLVKERLQQEVDKLQLTDSRMSKELKDAQAQAKSIENELEELKMSQPAAVAAAEAEMQLMREKFAASETTVQALQVAKEACEKQIEELKAQHSANGAELDAKHRALSDDFEALQARAVGLATDLAAATELAQARFRDVVELKEHLGKVQPEVKKLRAESEELKTVKAELVKKGDAVKRLESRERDLRSEIAEYKAQAEKKDAEVTDLKAKAQSSDERSKALEDTCERARKDLEANERTRDAAVDAKEKLQAELKTAQTDLRTTKASLDQLEVQVNNLRDEARTAREELQMKSAQHESAQSLMGSLQEQSRELGTQMKELRDRNVGLEEELSDTQRLLSERRTEGEKMRRLVAEAEGRAEARVRSMQERLDTAVEERDRAEDDASTVGRRKAREVEELKAKLRDAEGGATKAAEARAAAEKREREYSVRQEDLQRSATQAQEEISEVRTAMAQLRDALDEGERQSRELEKEKTELRRLLDEREARLEKLQKSSKSMAEELRGLQSKARQPSYTPSSRTSVDSASTRVMSPVPGRAGAGTPTGRDRGGQEVDYVYLKNVLLQFMEQKEKKHQMQLVPVLGMLLHFDTRDEQKWNAAIGAR